MQMVTLLIQILPCILAAAHRSGFITQKTYCDTNIVTGMCDKTSRRTSVVALTYFLQANLLYEPLTDKLVPASADMGMSQT